MKQESVNKQVNFFKIKFLLGFSITDSGPAH